MSARAAWRLESLGFSQVSDYGPGKSDWLGAGLPTEGPGANAPRVGRLARRDVPTCRLTERVGDVRVRVEAAGWDLCVVVNDVGIVLGDLRSRALAGDPARTAEEAMQPGPTTYRADQPAEETARHLAERDVPGVLVTTADGELIGYFRREDVPVSPAPGR
jgi:CBS domain-containing protein